MAGIERLNEAITALKESNNNVLNKIREQGESIKELNKRVADLEAAQNEEPAENPAVDEAAAAIEDIKKQQEDALNPPAEEPPAQ